MVYTVTLNPALDYVMKLARLRYDDINRTDGEEIYYGGKGINVSVILSRLSISNTALGFAGGFTGIKLEQMLENDGINRQWNGADGDHPECDGDRRHRKDGFSHFNSSITPAAGSDQNENGAERFAGNIGKFTG